MTSLDPGPHYPIDLDTVPGNWAVGVIGDFVADVRPGFPSGAHNRTGDGIVHLRPMNVTRSGTIDLSNVKYVVDEAGQRVRHGDVLFNNTNSPELVGKTAVIPSGITSAYSNHMTRLRPPEGIVPSFLAYQIHYLWMTGYFQHRCVNHVNQASISSKTLSETVPLVVPPTAEQRRIVAEIETQFTRLDAAVAALERAQANVKRYRGAILGAAVSGRLLHPETEIGVDGAAQSEGGPWPASWTTLRIGDIAAVGTGATPLKFRDDYYRDGTVPWVTSGALNEDIVHRPSGYVSELALRETSLRLYKPGALLVAMYGEGRTRGKCSELSIHATVNQAIAAVVFSSDAERYRPFVKLFLLSNYERMRNLASGGVQPNLNLDIIRNLEFGLPPLPEQQRIVSEVERRLSVIQSTMQTTEANARRATRIRQAILRKAFSGQLVPQDPEDEPASVMLERMTTERARSFRSDKNSTRRRTAAHDLQTSLF